MNKERSKSVASRHRRKSSSKRPYGSAKPSYRGERKRYRLRSPDEIKISRINNSHSNQRYHEINRLSSLQDTESNVLSDDRWETKSPYSRLWLNKKRMTSYDKESVEVVNRYQTPKYHYSKIQKPTKVNTYKLSNPKP